MPVVPRVEREVGINGLPSRGLTELPGGAPAEAFGGGGAGRAIGHSFERVGDAAAQVGERLRKQARDTAVEGFDHEAALEQTRIEADIKKLKRTNAAGSREYADQEWAKLGEKLRAKASGGDQQAALNSLLQNRYETIFRVSEFHAASELEAHRKEQNASYLAGIHDEAIRHKDDPELLSEALLKQDATIERHGLDDGLSAGEIARNKQVQGSATKLAIIESYLESPDPMRDSKAKAFLESNRDYLTPNDLKRASGFVEKATFSGESQRMADDIFRRGLSEDQAMAEVQKNYEAGKIGSELRDKLESRLEERYGDVTRRKREANEAVYLKATQFQESTRGRMPIPETIKGRLELGQITALENRRKQLIDGTDAAPNGPVYYRLRLMAEDPGFRQKFQTTDLPLFQDKMTPTELSKLIELQAGLKSKDGKADKVLDGYRSNSQIISDTAKAAKIDKDPDDLLLFHARVEEEMNAVQAKTQKPISNQEIQSIASRLAGKVVTDKGLLWNTRKRGYEVDKKDIQEIETNQIPALERRRAEEKLKKWNLPVTDDSVTELYNSVVQGRQPDPARLGIKRTNAPAPVAVPPPAAPAPKPATPEKPNPRGGWSKFVQDASALKPEFRDPMTEIGGFDYGGKK